MPFTPPSPVKRPCLIKAVPQKVRLILELLENRVLLSTADLTTSAIVLPFLNTSATYQTAHATESLANAGAVELNKITLNAGDVVTASVNTVPYGGGLDSELRVFQDLGGGNLRAIASNDNFQGKDPGLTFQAPAPGTYYIGISRFDNTAYDPKQFAGSTGSFAGLFDLHLAKTTAVAPPGLVGASFTLSQTTGVAGDQITIAYTIENRSAQTTGATSAALLVSADNRFDDDLPAVTAQAVPGLGAGEAYQGSFTITLGAAETAPQVFLGLQIGSTKPVSPEQGNDWAPLQVLSSKTVSAGGNQSSIKTAQPIEINSQIIQTTLPAGEEDFFKIRLTQAGNLTALVDAEGQATSLTLYDAQGIPIVRSDGQSLANLDPRIIQGLSGADAGTVYYLKVANLTGATAAYQLTTLFTSSASLLQTVPLGGAPLLLAEGDFNGDGHLDLVTDINGPTGVTVLLGNGDGTFQAAQSYSVKMPVAALAVGDFYGDGHLDIVVTNQQPNGIRILRGNGDGTFQTPVTLHVPGGNALAVGDFNGDGQLDLAVGAAKANKVSILLGNGNGTFQAPLTIAVPGGPAALASGDFNGDGRLDLAVADRDMNQVTVLLNQGGGVFHSDSYAVGQGPDALVAGDFNGDGRLDLATANFISGDVSILRGLTNGLFQSAGTYAVGSQPRSLVTADFDGNGQLDLAVANFSSNNVMLLSGNGDLTFHSTVVAAVAGPLALAAGDFLGDGRVDLAAADYASQQMTLLVGNGDGTFPHLAAANSTGPFPDATVSGDFNGDGRLDLAVANRGSGTMTVLLGQGDGTFQTAGTSAVGSVPAALVAGDFNGDGRLDLAVADYGYNGSPTGVTVLLGNGDGTFVSDGFYPLAGSPAALVAGDFRGDGRLDLAAAIKFNADSSYGSTVAVLLGNGNGTFQTPRSFTTGSAPAFLVTGDFTGNGRIDLATADYASATVTVLLGDGQGNFPAFTSYSIPGTPVALTAGDFEGNRHPDLVVATKNKATITILHNEGNGAFTISKSYVVDTVINALVAGEFTGDGRLDLVAVNYENAADYSAANTITVLLGDGAGAFQPAGTFPAGNTPSALQAGDFNNDGWLDLAVADSGTATVAVFLGTGSGSFVTPVLAPSPLPSTPLVANLTGSSTADSVVLTQSGQILLRRGIPGQPGAFAPPLVLNPGTRQAARDLALVQTSGGILLAALDATTFGVTPYQFHPDGSFTILADLALPAGFLPANIASADLTGDGLGDLVISAAASDQIFICLQTSAGVFGPIAARSVGVNPSAIALVDVNGDDRRDIVVTDRFSGQISVLLNNGDGTFLPEEERFRAGTGLYGLAPLNGTQVVQALEGTNGVVAGPFAGGPGNDLIVTNSGTDSLTLLRSDNLGGFYNPQMSQTVALGTEPTAIAEGHFITGDSNLDLAVLSAQSDTISIYRGDGHGGFTLIFTANAGNDPTGLSVADVSRPGGGGPDNISDLLVGNSYGDLLILTGNGNGSFSPYRRVEQKVSLAIASTGPGQHTFYFSNQGSDQLAYATAATAAAAIVGPIVFQDHGNGINAPGPAAVVSVHGTQYLVVVNSGGNDLLIIPLDANGRPLLQYEQTYATGTDPVGLTLTTPANDLNGDNISDVVVANQGSNDVSVFLGQMSATGWSLSYRPRQSSGGIGPTSVVVANVTGSAGPDLVVSNGQSNDVTVLPGRGNGFFTTPSSTDGLTFATGADPQQLYVGNFTGTGELDLLTINAASNNVTLITDFMTSPVTSTISSGGTVPLAGAIANIDGASALLVANSGNGVLELLQLGPRGFEATAALFSPAAPHLSDLALVTAGNELEVYGTDAGNEVAVLLGTFGPPQALTSFLPSVPGFPGGLDIVDNVFAGADPSNNPPPVFFVLASSTIFEGGTITNLTTATISPFAGSEGPRIGGAGQAQTGENPGGILLLNVADPTPGTNSNPVVPNNLQESNESLQETSTPTINLLAGPDRHPFAQVALPPEQPWQICLANPLPPLNRPNAGVIHLHPTAQVKSAAIVSEDADSCQPRAEQQPARLPSSQVKAAAALFVGWWYSFPQLAAAWLKPMRQPWLRLKTHLRKLRPGARNTDEAR